VTVAKSRGPLVIVGDAMLDVDVEGAANRLSPEAPVPVVDVERIWHRPGGAGLAALLAARHEDDVVLVAGFCDDDNGRRLRNLLQDGGVRVVVLPMTGTTVTKTRVRARGQSVLRIDEGSAAPVPGPLRSAVDAVLSEARAICVADYGAGVAALPALRAALSVAAKQAPVVWDPHPKGCTPVHECALVTPNEAEARHFCGGESVEVLRQKWRADAVCVTMGARGARVFLRDTARCHVGVPVLDVAGSARSDVCGAGDRFAIAAAEALAYGADPREAVVSAVEAAARFVAAGGASAVSTAATAHETRYGAMTLDAAPLAQVVELARRLRDEGRTVVATGGCFDLLHTGHIGLLRHARELGDALIVLVNSDDSVSALKGPHRPIMPAADRARVLGALACVDAVVVFDESTPERLLDRLRPDVWVKGGDYAPDELPEADVVTRHGGEVVILPTLTGYSSSQLIATARSHRTTEGNVT
jgi:rfaE bifunctional protein nucleotidyltransferase chain/domain/rfaE bifunctional protein kinase chain/domain